MKFKPKLAYFTLEDLNIILEFDTELEIIIEEHRVHNEYISALGLSKELELKPLSFKKSFRAFLADFKASRDK